mgnify:FL=1
MNKIAFFALMLALGLVGGCGNKKEEKKEEKDLARISQKQDQIEVKAAKARLAPFEMELVSNGKVNARRKAVLAFITNDVVRKVHVKNGERVKKGDPIVSVDELKAGQQLEAAVPHPVVKGRLRLHHQRQHPDILRVHGVECLRRLDGVALQQLRAAQARDGGDGQRHAAPADLPAHLHDLGGHVALAHPLQNVVAPGLQSHVDHGQALVPQRPQLLLRPDADGGRGRVAGDPLTLWEQLPNGVQNGVKLIRFPD